MYAMAIYGNRWRYVANLGAGGQGSVVLVTDTNGIIPGEVALKRLTNAVSEERRARFERETNALEALDHPNILKIYDKQLHPPTGEKPFFVAEHCSGKSLHDRGAGLFKGRVAEAAAVLIPIAGALSAAHERGVIHRDCKPQNILFKSDGTPVLCDFGICYVEDGELVTLSDAGMGSKHFIAPEMEAGGTGEASQAVDAYSLAKVLYWMVSGGRLLGRDNHREGANLLASSIENQRYEHLHAFLDGYLQSDPRKRRRFGHFHQDLEKLVMLIDGDFAPLNPSLAIRCRFCGLGTYQRNNLRQGQSVPEAGVHTSSPHVVGVMWCNHCGHVQTFNLKAANNSQWFNGKKAL